MEKILISDAAKQVQVESHVLRYWEEELHLPIQRNKQGHRFYTKEDVDRFKQIKDMKEQGFQLKAIRSALEGKPLGENLRQGPQEATAPQTGSEAVKKTQSKTGSEAAKKTQPKPAAEAAKKTQPKPTAVAAKKTQPKTGSEAVKKTQPKTGSEAVKKTQPKPAVEAAERQLPQPVLITQSAQSLPPWATAETLAEKDRKAARLQVLLQHMIAEAVRGSSEQFCEDVRQTVAKEMDYQFRQQDEKEDERERERLKREEEHYREVDLLLRGRNKKERRKKVFGVQKPAH